MKEKEKNTQLNIKKKDKISIEKSFFFIIIWIACVLTF